MRLNELLHLVAFPRKAHGKPPASGCVTAAKMPDSRAFSNSSGQFHSIHTLSARPPPPRLLLSSVSFVHHGSSRQFRLHPIAALSECAPSPRAIFEGHPTAGFPRSSGNVPQRQPNGETPRPCRQQATGNRTGNNLRSGSPGWPRPGFASPRIWTSMTSCKKSLTAPVR